MENNVVENKLEVVEQKLVPFGDYEILAVKTSDGKIRGAVKWVCKGIGLSEDQAKRQVKNIQSDLVVSKGVSNLTLPTNGGIQTILCIELNYLPLWLAKIAITPNMQETNPQAVDNLVTYQLEAKDVLAQAFLPQAQTQDPITLALEAALETRKQVQVIQTEVGEVKESLEELKDNLVVTSSQAKALNKKVSERVYAALGEKTPAFEQLKQKTFKACWRDFKDLFDITEYRDLPRIKYALGMQFLSGWEPNATMKFEIKQLNSQGCLFE